jgi:hypothetical protein
MSQIPRQSKQCSGPYGIILTFREFAKLCNRRQVVFSSVFVVFTRLEHFFRSFRKTRAITKDDHTSVVGAQAGPRRGICQLLLHRGDPLMQGSDNEVGSLDPPLLMSLLFENELLFRQNAILVDETPTQVHKRDSRSKS